MQAFTIVQDGLSLIVAGAVLYFLGLFQGLSIPVVRNARMALSGHLVALQSGMALMIFGIIWGLVDLSPTWSFVAAQSSIAGYYLVWFGITIASITGASKALPMAGQGFSAGRISETAVTALEAIGVLLSVLSAVLIIWGIVAMAGAYFV